MKTGFCGNATWGGSDAKSTQNRRWCRRRRAILPGFSPIHDAQRSLGRWWSAGDRGAVVMAWLSDSTAGGDKAEVLRRTGGQPLGHVLGVLTHGNWSTAFSTICQWPSFRSALRPKFHPCLFPAPAGGRAARYLLFAPFAWAKAKGRLWDRSEWGWRQLGYWPGALVSTNEEISTHFDLSSGYLPMGAICNSFVLIFSSKSLLNSTV